MEQTATTIVGNLTRDPELKFTPNGAPVCDFSIATNRRTFNKQSGHYEDGKTTYIDCTAWQQLAENIAQSVSRGEQVIATGRLDLEQWETNEGERRQRLKMIAEAAGPGLQYGTTVFTKRLPGGGQQAAGGAAWGSNPNAQPTAPGWGNNPQQRPSSAGWGNNPHQEQSPEEMRANWQKQQPHQSRPADPWQAAEQPGIWQDDRPPF